MKNRIKNIIKLDINHLRSASGRLSKHAGTTRNPEVTGKFMWRASKCFNQALKVTSFNRDIPNFDAVDTFSLEMRLMVSAILLLLVYGFGSLLKKYLIDGIIRVSFLIISLIGIYLINRKNKEK